MNIREIILMFSLLAIGIYISYKPINFNYMQSYIAYNSVVEKENVSIQAISPSKTPVQNYQTINKNKTNYTNTNNQKTKYTKTNNQKVVPQKTAESHTQTLDNKNEQLIHAFSQAVDNILAHATSDSEQKKYVELAAQSYKALYDYNMKNPKYKFALTQKQKDIITKYSKSLCKYKNLTSIIDPNYNVINEEFINTFIKAVNDIPFYDRTDSTYLQKLNDAIELFKKYKTELKNKKRLSKNQGKSMKQAMKRLFGSITKQQVLDYGIE
jgi:hypothetical protein